MHIVWIWVAFEISEAFWVLFEFGFELAFEIYFKNTWQILVQKYERIKHDTPKMSEENIA